MLKGIHLTLMIGPAVPVPVPQLVLDALTSLEVTIRDSGPSAFQLGFTLNNRSPLHTMFLLAGSSPVPVMRVIIIITMNGQPNVIMDGVVTQQQNSPGKAAGESMLHLTGEDLSALMKLNDSSGRQYPAMPAEGRVALILAQYAGLGIIPKIKPSVLIDVPIPTNAIPCHGGSDLAYINCLAKRVGYVFYIDPGPKVGSSTAYWGPQVKVGVPQPALNVNMDAHTNVESLNFTFDGQSRVLPLLRVQQEDQNILIPVPDITPLNPPLGLVEPLPNRVERLTDTAGRSTTQAAVIAMTKAANSAEAVKGEGSLDVVRYGRLLQSRQLVGVRGAGPAFDGLHYVSSVTHRIQRGEYKQSFNLSGNGLISTIQRVLV
jgi:hypothetical protein